MAKITCVNTYANLQTKSKLNEISLKLLAEYYKEYIMCNNYEYTLEDDTVILLKPLRENFCHLLSVEKVAEAFFGQNHNMLFSYRGDKGFKRIMNGRVTIEHLEGLCEQSKDLVEDNEDKFVFFNFLHILLDNPTAVKYVVKKGRVELDFIFYNSFSGAIVHLGIQKRDKHFDYYVPRMFVARYVSANNARKYIDGQTAMKIKKVQKTARSANTSVRSQK